MEESFCTVRSKLYRPTKQHSFQSKAFENVWKNKSHFQCFHNDSRVAHVFPGVSYQA